MPRLMLTTARKLKNELKPCCALSPATAAIVNGPDMFLSDTWPTIMCAIIFTVSDVISQVFATPRGNDSSTP